MTQHIHYNLDGTVVVAVLVAVTWAEASGGPPPAAPRPAVSLLLL